MLDSYPIPLPNSSLPYLTLPRMAKAEAWGKLNLQLDKPRDVEPYAISPRNCLEKVYVYVHGDISQIIYTITI